MNNVYSRLLGLALASTSALAINSAAHAQRAATWTGYYIGVNAGAAWGQSDATSTVPCGPTVPPGYFCSLNDPASLANAAAIASAGSGSMSGTGFTGGGQIGYNWQINNVVYGVEADFGAFNINGSRQAGRNYPVGAGLVTTGEIFSVGTTFNTDWLFTARGRVGWTFSNALIYGTGGLALTNLEVSNSFIDTAAPPFPISGSSSAAKVGWVLGGGVEWALGPDWSAKAEFLYVDFGSVTVNSATTMDFGGAYSQGISTSVDLTAQIARVGVNRRF